MTAVELEQLYLDTFKKITGDVPEGVPAGIDINSALGLDSRFVLGSIIHHIRESRRDMKQHRDLLEDAGLSEEEKASCQLHLEKMTLMALEELNLKIKDTGFTILFDEKVLD